ncbi:MAG TPA: YhdT family protein [Bacillota bacterium]|nr:YhdT family protein [Bacillota bacterium]
MKKMTKEQKHEQCVREIRGTLIVTAICCAWHVITAFALNGTGLYFIGMPAWFSVSVFGTIIIALLGIWYLMKKVFVDFDYDDEDACERGEEA